MKQQTSVVPAAKSTSVANKAIEDKKEVKQVKQRRRPTKFTKEEVRFARQLYFKEHYTLRQIAEMTRMSKSTVWRLVKDHKDNLQSDGTQASDSTQANNSAQARGSAPAFSDPPLSKKNDEGFEEVMAGMERLTTSLAALLEAEKGSNDPTKPTTILMTIKSAALNISTNLHNRVGGFSAVRSTKR